MIPAEWFEQPFWIQLAATLLHFIWQGTLVAGIVGLLLISPLLKRANSRYLACVTGMAAMALLPCVTFFTLESSFESALAGGETVVLIPAKITGSLNDPTVTEAASTDVGTVFRIPPEWPYWTLSVWLTGVVFFGSRLLLGLFAVSRFTATSAPAPERIAELVRRISRRVGCHIRTRVVVSTRIAEPIAVRILRASIVLPAAWLVEVPADVLESVIAHELAHIRRRDLWINLFQRIVETLLFYHPSVWWLSSRTRWERELCCDELAVQAVGSRAAYARALEFVAHRRVHNTPAPTAAGFGGQKMAVLKRVKRVLGLDAPDRSMGWWPVGGVAIVACALSLTYFSGAVAQDERADDGETSEAVETDEAEVTERDRDEFHRKRQQLRALAERALDELHALEAEDRRDEERDRDVRREHRERDERQRTRIRERDREDDEREQHRRENELQQRGGDDRDFGDRFENFRGFNFRGQRDDGRRRDESDSERAVEPRQILHLLMELREEVHRLRDEVHELRAMQHGMREGRRHYERDDDGGWRGHPEREFDHADEGFNSRQRRDRDFDDDPRRERDPAFDEERRGDEGVPDTGRRFEHRRRHVEHEERRFDRQREDEDYRGDREDEESDDRRDESDDEEDGSDESDENAVDEESDDDTGEQDESDESEDQESDGGDDEVRIDAVREPLAFDFALPTGIEDEGVFSFYVGFTR